MSVIACTVGRCLSPVACAGWSYCREINADAPSQDSANVHFAGRFTLTALQFSPFDGIVPLRAENAKAARIRGGLAKTGTHFMSLSTSYAQATSSPIKSGLLPAKAWLAQMLKEGQKRRFSWVGTVTPDIARAILEHNIGNRPIRAARVQQHIARLHAGKFILTHQGAALAKNGQLNDGQHRLIAISEADIPAELEVTFGCEREEFAVVDQGYARTSDNILSIQGFKNPAVVGSLCRMLMVIEGKKRIATQAQEVSEYATEHYCTHMENACAAGQLLGKVTSPTAIAIAYYWIATHSPSLTVTDDLNLFWKGMTTGESLTGPRLRLREWLIRKETIRSNGRDENFRRAAGIIDAWDAWKAGRKTIRTDWPHVTTLPKVTR